MTDDPAPATRQSDDPDDRPAEGGGADPGERAKREARPVEDSPGREAETAADETFVQRWFGSPARLAGRAIWLTITGLVLYFVYPSLVKLFGQFDQLKEVAWWAFSIMFAFQVASFICQWWLLRIAMTDVSWFTIATSQLAGNAVANAVPAGTAAGAALQQRMMIESGVDPTRSVTGVAAVTLISYATIFAFPVLALPALVFGAAVDPGLVHATIIAALIFPLLYVAGWWLMRKDRPVEYVGRTLQRLINWVNRRFRKGHAPLEDLAERVVIQRNEIRSSLGSRWHRALAAAVGNWGLDFLALWVAVYAVGSRPRSSIVLLAYVVAKVIAMFPITPGGIGLVEAGLTGMLTLAGVPATNAALATLAFRLVSYWLPMPAGVVAYFMHRHRVRTGRLEGAGQAAHDG